MVKILIKWIPMGHEESSYDDKGNKKNRVTSKPKEDFKK